MTLFQLDLNLRDQAANQLPYGTVTSNPLGLFISNIVPLILIISGFMVLVNFIQAGFEWISAGGDKGKIEKAREKITGTIIGLIVLLSAFSIFFIMQRVLNVNILNINGSAANNTTGTSTTKTLTPAEQSALQNQNAANKGAAGAGNAGGSGVNLNSLKQVR